MIGTRLGEIGPQEAAAMIKAELKAINDAEDNRWERERLSSPA